MRVFYSFLCCFLICFVGGDCLVKVKKYLLNALMLSAFSIVLHALSVSFNIYLSGKIGSEGMGVLTLGIGIYSFSITLATSGVNLAVVRLVSASFPYGLEGKFDKNSDRRVSKIMKSALLYALFFSTVSGALLFFLSPALSTHILGDTRILPYLRVMSFTLIPISLSSAISGYFCAVRRVYKNVLVQLFEQTIKMSAIIYLAFIIFPSPSIKVFCICVSLGTLLAELFSVSANGILYFVDRRVNKIISDDLDGLCFDTKKQGALFKLNYVNGGHTFDFSRAQLPFFIKRDGKSTPSLFSIAFPVAVSQYARSLLTTIEHLLIPWGLRKSSMSYEMALSSYGILHGMVFPVLFFPSAILSAFSSLLVPEISSAFEKKDMDGIRKIVSSVFSFSLLFSIFISGIFFCFADELGLCLFDSLEAGKYLRILSPLVPLMYLDSAVDSILKGLGEQLHTMKINIMDSLLSVFLLFILLPRHAVLGYIIVIFITELFNTSLSILHLLNITKLKTQLFSWVIKPILFIFLSTVITRAIFNFGIFTFIFRTVPYERSLLLLEITVSVALYTLLCVFFLFKRDNGKYCSLK